MDERGHGQTKYCIRENFCLTPALFVLQKYSIFSKCGKGRHILYVIIIAGQNIKILLTRADGENFLLAKISVYMATRP